MRLLGRKAILAAVCGAFVQLSCSGGGGDSVTAPEVKVPTTVTAATSTSMSGTAGEVVTPAPAVIVKDQPGQPTAGVAVTFAVVEGGGSVTGASAVTNADGVATVGSWTLGKTSGANTVTATVGQLTPVTFTANGGPGQPAALSKTAGDGQTAVSGAGVLVAPSVTVADANGNGVPNIAVTFTVASGAGTVIGGNATTNAQGVAAPTGWILGKTPGANTLTASAPNLAAVTFNATGTPGAPALLIKRTDVDNFTLPGGFTVGNAPSVFVKDANGNLVPDATVKFSVGDGEGIVSGETAKSDANGVATVGSWTLGYPGTNTLIATSGDASTTFTITATDPCLGRLNHDFDVQLHDALTKFDCKLDNGVFSDRIQLTSSRDQLPHSYIVSLSSSTFDTYLYVLQYNLQPLAENDNSNGSSNSSIRVLLSTGALLAASSAHAGVTGDYTLTTTEAPEDVGNCALVYTAPGMGTANQKIEKTDCEDFNYYYDKYRIYVAAGQTITVDLYQTQFGKHFSVWDTANNNVYNADDKKLVFTAPKSAYYDIRVMSPDKTTMGTYGMTIQ